MKKENINNYYTDEDLINFEKLKNFKEFKVNKLNNNQNNSHPVRYAVSDNRNFNKIMNVGNNNEKSSSEEVNRSKDYKASDFEIFKKLKQFTTFNDNEPLNNKYVQLSHNSVSKKTLGHRKAPDKCQICQNFHAF